MPFKQLVIQAEKIYKISNGSNPSFHTLSMAEEGLLPNMLAELINKVDLDLAAKNIIGILLQAVKASQNEIVANAATVEIQRLAEEGTAIFSPSKTWLASIMPSSNITIEYKKFIEAVCTYIDTLDIAPIILEQPDINETHFVIQDEKALLQNKVRLLEEELAETKKKVETVMIDVSHHSATEIRQIISCILMELELDESFQVLTKKHTDLLQVERKVIQQIYDKLENIFSRFLKSSSASHAQIADITGSDFKNIILGVLPPTVIPFTYLRNIITAERKFYMCAKKIVDYVESTNLSALPRNVTKHDFRIYYESAKFIAEKQTLQNRLVSQHLFSKPYASVDSNLSSSTSSLLSPQSLR